MILSDPGGEFDSDLWRAMTERFNIGVFSTTTLAHFSNGVVERHNQTLKTMVVRLLLDHPGAIAQELVDLACLAKNSMVQHSGASLFQLMGGSTPRVPAALTHGLPALVGGTVPGDDALRLHLPLLHAARVAHTQAEADGSLRRALARNASNVPHRDWKAGDVVYYWTEGATPSQGSWNGPTHLTDVAVAKRAVRIQHGHSWTERHVSQFRLAGEAHQSATDAVRTPTATNPAEEPPITSLRASAANPSSPSDPPASRTAAGNEVPLVDEGDADGHATASMVASARAAIDCVDAAPLPTRQSTPVQAPGPWTGRTRSLQAHFFSGTPPGAAANLKGFRHAAKQRTAALRDLAASDRRTARRLMANGSHKRHSLSPADDTLSSSLHRTGAADHEVFITRREMRRRAEVPIGQAGTAFDPAMARELEAWSDLAVYTEVPYTGQAVISTRWVLKLKQPNTPTGAPRRKARLVVRGFEDPDKDAVDSTSPTASRTALRVVLSALATHGFIPRTVDACTAFVQGTPLDRPAAVFVQPPPQAQFLQGMVRQLRKCAYGLTDAPRRWYDSVLKLMLQLRLTRSTMDHGLFARHEGGRLVLDVAVHVDDFLLGGTAAAVKLFDHGQRGSCEAGPTASGDLTNTGLRIKTAIDDDTGTLTIRGDQDTYLDSIETIYVRSERKMCHEAPLTAIELTSYRRSTGALLWGAGQTLPYLACAATTLARRFTSAVVHDLMKANRVIVAAKAARPFPFTYIRLHGSQRLRLFVDSSSIKAGVPTAHTGFAIFASPSPVPAGKMTADAPLILLQCGSHRQRRVTHS